MKIDKSALLEKLITLANATNESAAKLNRDTNKVFFHRLCEFCEAIRTPYPEFAAIIRIEQCEADDYHIIENIVVKDWHCFLIGEAQVELILHKIAQNHICEEDGESDGFPVPTRF